MAKIICKNNISEASEEIKQLLMTSTDLDYIVDKLVDYGIYLNKAVDSQKITDLTIASFDEDRFQQLLLEYAENSRPAYGEENPISDNTNMENDNGVQILSEEEWDEALRGLKEVMEEDGEEEKK